ncbi:hypothetical protein IMG5_189650 [Ichthyophthirius multifiliis]|uniref:Dynein regulatory complex subunit 2 n=1 Tax=Ichthyophthirius multifiliis TaxID=5932 RepID=G0R444_ICHMU|nr:hypothetical protein IMG5_189650 [Ichthyophthirius multifiliis]EGR27764.1 hypothetical protein IMG5_189650 [Ichthyophthirius multifiliis]|eukprot:XP_004025216.1 hypothetical protein IMG5_189650 [Ichthyophthirius multifiliis]
MALLGKTLKGRSTRPGGLPQKRNIKYRQLAKNQEEFDQLKQLAKLKREGLKNRIKDEQKIVLFNKKKLLTYWRKIMRIAKTEQIKNEIDIYSQNNQRELDSKEAFIQMLDKNLDEAEDQFQIALRNHLMHTDNLNQLQEARMRGLQEEFNRDIQILENEFDLEREDMVKTHKTHLKELEDMIETVKEEDKKKMEEAQNEFSQFKEETKNKNLEETNVMKIILETKQTKYYTELEQMNSKFQSDTSNKVKDHQFLHQHNKNRKKEIDRYLRMIASKKANIELEKVKINQHCKEFNARNQALKKEKENISNSYHDLKHKMQKFREEESNRLKELTNNSRNTVLKLKEYALLGEKILKTAELCRRLETEKEKVIPFYEETVDDDEIPQQLKDELEYLKPEEKDEYSYLNNFYKRYNKVLLDKLAIDKQKENLQKDNKLLKSLLKQYLDGISLNDDVLKNENNPLLVVNHKFNLGKIQAERYENKTIIEGPFQVRSTQMQLQGQKPGYF